MPESSTITKKSKPDVDFEKLKKTLLDLENISSPQTRGYAFEKYLNELYRGKRIEESGVL